MHKTSLNSRTLYFDGESVVSERDIIRRLERGLSTKGLFVSEITPTIAQYNKSVQHQDKIETKTELNTELLKNIGYWNLPDPYLNLDVDEYVLNCLAKEFSKNKWLRNDGSLSQEAIKRVDRTNSELLLYKSHKLHEFLRVLIYVINTLENNSIVWGVGRGSSVSSYVLYLIGVHDVDSVAYELDIEDFLH